MILSFLITLVEITSPLGFLALVVISTIARRCVPGSHIRYQLVGAIVTLAWMVMITAAITVLISATRQDALAVAFDLLRMILTYFEWKHFKDEDNWWKGRGKKWLQSLDNALGRFQPSPTTG